MHDLNEHTITAEALPLAANAADPCVKFISAALIRHLHDFIRELEPTSMETVCSTSEQSFAVTQLADCCPSDSWTRNGVFSNNLDEYWDCSASDFESGGSGCHTNQSDRCGKEYSA